MEDEYELVPLSPIRRLEKRVERVERSAGSGELIKDLIDVVRTNQQIVDEIVKINSEMINRVTELSTGVTELTARINDFMERLEVVESSAPAAPQKDERIEKMEKKLNALLLQTMAKRRMAQRPMPAGMANRPAMAPAR